MIVNGFSPVMAISPKTAKKPDLTTQIETPKEQNNQPQLTSMFDIPTSALQANFCAKKKPVTLIDTLVETAKELSTITAIGVHSNEDYKNSMRLKTKLIKTLEKANDKQIIKALERLDKTGDQELMSVLDTLHGDPKHTDKLKKLAANPLYQISDPS